MAETSSITAESEVEAEKDLQLIKTRAETYERMNIENENDDSKGSVFKNANMKTRPMNFIKCTKQSFTINNVQRVLPTFSIFY